MRKADLWKSRWVGRSARLRLRPHPLPWGSIVIVLLALVALPTAVDIWIAQRHPSIVTDLHYGVTGVYALASAMLLGEALAAWRRLGRRLPAVPDLPRCTAIVAAYLPNEQEIIGETLTHLLTRIDVPADRFQIILAYNTPETLAVEADLQQQATHEPRLLPLRVSGSRSKAENVNAALGVATGEIVAVFDADHLPAPDCFRRAWQSLSPYGPGGGCDMVQGRCLIRNHADNALTRTIAIEFDTIYAVSHPGRAALSGAAIFGGSNGYWRRDILRDLGMDSAMLTEDIDVSVRALLAGRRLIHDPAILSTELAPLRGRDWLLQRKRWAQGWLEVALKHTGALMRSPHLSPPQKILWFYLLAWREVYPVLSLQFFPLILTSALTGLPIHWFGTPFFLIVGLFNLACGPLMLLTTYLCAPPRLRHGLGRWYWLHGLLSLAYTTLKLIVTLIAQVSHLLRDRDWVTTPRLRSTTQEKAEVVSNTAVEDMNSDTDTEGEYLDETDYAQC